MRDNIQDIIQSLSQKKMDKRINLFNISILSLENNSLVLSGNVLEQEDLNILQRTLLDNFKDLVLETDAINVLRKPTNPVLTVGTNLTSLHISTSFLSEMSSQLLYGEKLEILSEEDKWAFTRQTDGYLGWAYKPYLTGEQLPTPTHIVISPSSALHASPDRTAQTLTRVYCGTYVTVKQITNNWAKVIANATGWVELSDLRPLTEFPTTTREIRDQITVDTQRMIGVPYLWGGVSGNGIDCSGFARLLHRWIGLNIPRDADMQSAQCRKIEPPFEPGDLCFFGEASDNRRITHVGVSLGGWQIMHSSRSRNGVYMDDIQENTMLKSIFLHGGTFLNN